MPNPYLLLKEKMLTNAEDYSDLAQFLKKLSQGEKPSEIKPPSVQLKLVLPSHQPSFWAFSFKPFDIKSILVPILMQLEILRNRSE